VTCTLLAAYNLSKGHPHFEEPPVRSRSWFLAISIRCGPSLMFSFSSLIAFCRPTPICTSATRSSPGVWTVYLCTISICLLVRFVPFRYGLIELHRGLIIDSTHDNITCIYLTEFFISL
jgi:hypothetical protein